MHCKTEPQRDDVEFYSGRMAQHYCLGLMSFEDVRRGENGSSTTAGSGGIATNFSRLTGPVPA